MPTLVPLPFAPGDVELQRHVAGDRPVLVPQRLHIHLRPERPPVAGAVLNLPLERQPRFTGFGDRRERGPVRLRAVQNFAGPPALRPFGLSAG